VSKDPIPEPKSRGFSVSSALRAVYCDINHRSHPVVSIADEAFKVGRTDNNPFKVVGSAAWPVRALVERGRTQRLHPVLSSLIDFSPQIESPASRSEALFLLLQAIFPAGRRWWEPVLNELIQSSEPVVHWRQGRNLRDPF